MQSSAKTVRIVVVSDTHNSYPKVPPGDIFIHCGDLTSKGSLSEIESVCGYIKSLQFKHKIVISGNHDVCLDEKNYERLRSNFILKDGEGEKAREKLKAVCTFLEHEWTEVEGIRIFGSPFTPQFHNWGFMYNKDEAKHIWDIGNGPLDILVTHGPPFGILDLIQGGKNEGCPELLQLTKRLRPKYHLFGHIHEAYGTVKNEHTTYINCSSKNFYYKLVNAPVVIDYPV